MVFPLGIGVGDFVIVLGLISRAVNALKKSGGAASEYQEVVLELETLSRILHHVESRHYTSSIAENHANAVRGLVLNCQRPLEQFLDKIVSFEASLGATTGRGLVRTSPRKIRWAVFLRSEVPELRSLIAAKVLQLQLLFQSFSFETTSVTQTKLDEVERKATTIRETVDLRAKEHDEAFAVTDRKIDRLSQTTTSQLDLISRCQTQYFPILLQHVKSVSQVPKDIAHNQRKYFLRVFSVLRLTNIKIDELRMIGAQLVVVSRTALQEIRELLQKLCETNARTHNAILQTQRSLDVSRPLSIQGGVYFEDALGREFNLPYDLFCHWEVFEALLKAQFQERPGEENIRTGNFCLFSDKAQRRLVKKDDWSRLFFPGTRLLMSMILLSVSVFDEMCPRGCGTPGKKILQTSTSLVCPNCDLQYNQLDMFTESRTQDTSNKNDTFGDSRISEFTGSLKGEPGAPGPDLDQTRKDTERLRSDEERERETQALQSFKRVHINMAYLESYWKIALYTRFEYSIVRLAKIDTTLSFNYMDQYLALSLGVELEPYYGPPLVDLTGRTVKLLGTCQLDWCVIQRTRTYRDKFFVTEVSYEPDVILGTYTFDKVGFFRRNNAVW